MIQIPIADRQGLRSGDLVSCFACRYRTVLLCGEITEALACDVVLQIEYLSLESTADILLYIQSPGGSVSAGLAIYDAMQRSRCDIATVCLGTASSMAAVLVAAGTPGKRYCTPHGELMIHQVLGGMQGRPATSRSPPTCAAAGTCWTPFWPGPAASRRPGSTRTATATTS